MRVLATLVAATSSCSTNSECQYNGVCQAQTCSCDPGWKGSTCGELDLLPSSFEGTGAYGFSPNVSSWGGAPLLVNGTYHLYVAEMINGW